MSHSIENVGARSTRRDIRRQAIMEAAAELFLDKGYAATSLADVVRRSGGSLQTLYELFGSKDGLFKALIESRCAQVTDVFDEADFAKFLELLPRTLDGQTIRHVVEPRSETFATPAFVKLAREFGVAICYTDHIDYVNIADITGDFVYARLQRGKDKVKTGYSPKEIDTWAKHAKTWAAGKDIAALPHADKAKATAKPRDVFVYFIHEGKVRAPAAAMELIKKLK